MKTAFVTGTTGQDCSFLTELLLSKNYQVHGLVRRTSAFNRERIDHISKDNFFLYYGDMTDPFSLYSILKKVQPDEVYHLAAQSHVGISFSIPKYTEQVNAEGTINLLEAIRHADCNPRIYNACTSEVFGGCYPGEKLNEHSDFNPKSPYATSKVNAYYSMHNYMDEYGFKIWNGFLFNHESNRRGENFVTRKITLSLARILAGKQRNLELGNIEAKRDWGYSPEYVLAQYMMLQSNKPDDYVIATGETHSVREFFEEAFRLVGLESHNYVRINPVFTRPVDVEYLCGDYSKAKTMLEWEPKTRFKQLVRLMLESDLQKENVQWKLNV